MTSKPAISPGTWKASELRKLSAVERDAILAEAAAIAEPEYRTNKQLTDFEAFAEDDLHGESTAVWARDVSV